MASLPLTLGLKGPLLLAFAGPPHAEPPHGDDAASPTPSTPANPTPVTPVAGPPPPMAPLARPVPPASRERPRLRFVGIGSTAQGDLLPYASYYGGGSVGFELEAGGFYRRRPRVGSAFTLGVVPSGFFYFPRFVVAHRLYVRKLLLSKPDFRVESLVNVDTGLGASISIPGLHVGVGWSTRLVFRDRFFLNVKPVSFEVTAPDFTTPFFVALRYGAALSMGTAF